MVAKVNAKIRELGSIACSKDPSPRKPTRTLQRSPRRSRKPESRIQKAFETTLPCARYLALLSCALFMKEGRKFSETGSIPCVKENSREKRTYLDTKQHRSIMLAAFRMVARVQSSASHPSHVRRFATSQTFASFLHGGRK